MLKAIRKYFSSVGILVASTIGAGIFALPKTFETGGWLPGIIYLLGFSGVLIYVHYIYWLALEKKGMPSLLGLVDSELGGWAKKIGFVSIILGLLLTLSAYIVLGGNFLQKILPIPSYLAVLFFWILCSLPILFNFSRFVFLEVAGAVAMVISIIYLFLVAPKVGNFFSAPLINLKEILFPFGPFLFALAGWTAIEPLLREAGRGRIQKHPIKILSYGTLIVAFVYLIFSMAIFGSSTFVSGDSLAGIDLISGFGLGLIVFLGLMAIWTSYLPIVLEIKKAIHRDLKFSETASFAVPIFLPILLFWAGLNNFLLIISLVGGVFLAIQYVLVVFASEKALNLQGWKSVLAGICGLVFILGAIYEIVYFLIR